MAGALPLYGTWSMSVPVIREHLACEVRGAAGAERRVGELAGLRLGESRRAPSPFFAGESLFAMSSSGTIATMAHRREVLLDVVVSL